LWEKFGERVLKRGKKIRGKQEKRIILGEKTKSRTKRGGKKKSQISGL